MPPAKRRRLNKKPTKVSLPPQKPTLFDLFDYQYQYPIFESICSLLPIGDLISLTRTCKRLSSLYQTLLPTQWNIDRRLHRFVKDPKGLRSQIGAHDALISGSFVIQFFERVTWKESDLDIFIEQGPGALALEKYFCEQEGYGFSYESPREEYDGAIIHIAKAILSGFYTTLVVNVVTWNTAYALYPQPSFLYHKTYLLRPLTDYLGETLAKYDTRGWKSQDVLWPEDEASHGSMLNRRRLGDRLTWKIPLDVRGVDRPDKPDSVLEYSCWKLTRRLADRRDDTETDFHYYSAEAQEFKAVTLGYRYTFHSYSDSFWLDFVGPRMDRMTLLELYKVPVSSRSQHISDTMERRSWGLRNLGNELARCNIRLPSYDHEIPGWWAEWEKQKASKDKKSK
ncbi:MAG: hypothetical protein Q9179_001655 [Wetmoreana sp. 5 TL-2023]